MKLVIFATFFLSFTAFENTSSACENYTGTYEQTWTLEQPLVLEQTDCAKVTVVTKDSTGQTNHFDIVPAQTSNSYTTDADRTYKISYRWEGKHFQMVRDILDVDGRLMERFTSTYNLDSSRDLRFDLVYVDYDPSGEASTYSSSATLKRIK